MLAERRDPATGPTNLQYIDTETYLPLQMSISIEVPQLGGEVEQTTEFLDYKEVDGVQSPFRLRATSSLQNFSITIAKVEHNVKVDEALFSKPAAAFLADGPRPGTTIVPRRR